MKLTFSKDGDLWYINLPKYEGPKGDLLMVAGADKLLDKIDTNEDGFVEVNVSLEKSKEYDVKLTKLFNISGGASYFAKAIDNLFSRPIWLCKVTKYVFNGELPKRMYINY